jgi:hypothetical protein
MCSMGATYRRYSDLRRPRSDGRDLLSRQDIGAGHEHAVIGVEEALGLRRGHGMGSCYGEDYTVETLVQQDHGFTNEFATTIAKPRSSSIGVLIVCASSSAVADITSHFSAEHPIRPRAICKDDRQQQKCADQQKGLCALRRSCLP